MSQEKERIAKRVAQELPSESVINLGIGLPTLVSQYIPEGANIQLHSENGILRMGPAPPANQYNANITNAGAQPATILPGGAFFDSALSFAIIRGGHIDVTVLGALEVDETGSLAIHVVPGKMASGMGGAMDLVAGSKKVIVAMTHTLPDGTPKILKKCTLPLTAVNKVTMIVTELGVMEVTSKGLLLTEVAPGITPEYVQSQTGAQFILSPRLKTMSL